MSDTVNALLVVLFGGSLLLVLRRDLIGGLCYGLFLCVSLPTYLRIETPGDLPEFTIQRVVLICLLAAALRNWNLHGRIVRLPLGRLFLFFIVANTISMLGSVSFAGCLKSYLDIAFEVAVLFLVMTSLVRRRADGLRVVRAIWLGLCLVAALAFLEKSAGISVTRSLFPAFEAQAGSTRDVVSTFPHRILLGTAMAMALPLGVAMVSIRGISKRLRILGWVSVGGFLASNYFAMSRGPWLAAAGAGLTLAVLGGRTVRKAVCIIGIGCLIALAAHPGVVESLVGRAQQTVDEDSFKGGTFLYRFELWKIAAHEVTKSPWRFFFGYGPGAGTLVDIDWDLSYRNRVQTIQSWDNHFAYDLFQAGFVGLIATLAFYFGAARMIFAAWKRATGDNKELLACLLACAVVLLFMRTNVLIFAMQLEFLFWAAVSAAFAIGGLYSRVPTTEQVLAEGATNEMDETLEMAGAGWQSGL